MRYLSIKNFDRFQHYKSNNSLPAWIKLHKSLLTDYEFRRLSDKAKGQLVMIWLLASQRPDRIIPDDASQVGQMIGAAEEIDLPAFVAAGWLIPLECSPQSALERSKESALEQIRI